MPRFNPITYPGARPDGPSLVFNRVVHPAVVDGDTLRPFQVGVEAQGAPIVSAAQVRWVLAYGSNASPDRLVDKGLDIEGCWLVPCMVEGVAPVWEARRSATGAVPLTLAPAPRRLRRSWALGVSPRDLATLDRTEFRGTNYRLVRIGPLALGERFLVDGLAYGPGETTRVLLRGNAPMAYPKHAQAAAVRALGRQDLSIRATPVGEEVADGWPLTPLRDLPLFVYGTLQPGGALWPRIADLVEVVGAGSTRGDVVHTPHGWPAASFAAAGRIHGTVLRPRPGRAAELVATCDRLESAPTLFLRRSVAVDLDGQTPTDGGETPWTWAISYEWNPAQGMRPGALVPDGRWTPRGAIDFSPLDHD